MVNTDSKLQPWANRVSNQVLVVSMHHFNRSVCPPCALCRLTAFKQMCGRCHKRTDRPRAYTILLIWQLQLSQCELLTACNDNKTMHDYGKLRKLLQTIPQVHKSHEYTQYLCQLQVLLQLEFGNAFFDTVLGWNGR